MTELHRRARELIRAAGDGDGPTAKQRSRLRASVLAQVGVGVGAATIVAGSAGTAAAGTKVAAAVAAGEAAPVVAGLSAAAGGGAFAKVVAVVAIAVGVGGGGYAVVSHFAPTPVTVAPLHGAAAAERALAPAPAIARGAAPAVTASPAPLSTAEEPTVPRIQAAPAARVDQAAVPRVELPSAVALKAVPVTPSVAPVTAVVTVETLEAETRALQSTVALLRDGQGERALAALDEQDALYPPLQGGMLGEEREATRIDALCLLGRGRADEARQRGARFLDAHPRSVLAARVRASCGGASPKL